MKTEANVCNRILLISYIVFTGLFLLSGVIGHAPWKQDETYTFGIIYHFYTTHSWLVPTNAGQPFMEKPPLYYWSAVLLCKILPSSIALPDAARLTSVLYMLVTLCFMWKTSSIVFRNTPRTQEMPLISLALFLSTLGVVRHSHDMFTDVALLTGSTIAFYALALLTVVGEWKKSGVWLGIGIGIAFLSKGFFTPGIFAFSFILLLITQSRLRNMNTLNALLIAGIVVSPFLLIWPALLYQHSHDQFMQWFWENNIGRFLGFSVKKLGAGNEPYYILTAVMWFAFPSFWLALFALWRHMPEWKKPEYALPILFLATGMLLLLVSASARALYLLPLTPAFAILATTGLTQIPDKLLNYWNKLIRFLSVLATASVWVIWWSLQIDHPLPHILPIIGHALPVDFVPEQSQTLAIIAAASAGIFLLIAQGIRMNPDINASRLWFTGLASLWISVNTLLMPWIDYTKSYQPVLAKIQTYVKSSSYKNNCMNDYHLGESIAPMLEYFSDSHKLNTIEELSEAHCPLMLTVTSKKAPENLFPAWNLLWKGSRDLDEKDEELRLYVKNNP